MAIKIQGTTVIDDSFQLQNVSIPSGISISGYATESYVANAVADLVSSAPSTLDTLNELAAALGDDANYASTVTTALSTKSPSDSPTFTGTVTLPIISEPLYALSGATGTVTHNLNTSNIFYHTSVAANFTANFTNVPTTQNRVISITLIIEQGSTAYIPNAVEIDGSAKTIKWAEASAPSGNANNLDVVSFSLINNNGTWTVIGSLSKFG